MSFKHLHNRQGFFSDYYLGTIFGRGTGRGSKRKLFRKEDVKTFWQLKKLHQRVEGRDLKSAVLRDRYANSLLRDILGYYMGDGEEGIYPLYGDTAAASENKRPVLFVFIGDSGQPFETTTSRKKDAPKYRLEKVLDENRLDYGLMVNDKSVRLIRRRGQGPKGAYIELNVDGCLEDDDGESFAAARLLFRLDTFIPNDEGLKEIDAIEVESRAHAEKVSDDLKRAVFTSAEKLIGALIEDKRDRAREAGLEFDPSQDDLRLYRDAALLCLYRLLFILYAEAWFVKLLAHDIYFESYSLSYLVEQLYRYNLDDLPENRQRFWGRLVALFRVYDKGLLNIPEHENIPPRGGDFFSETTPDGLVLAEAELDDRTIAGLVLLLATTSPRRGIGRERVSFRELGIEQLGSVYEGLLEYEPKIADRTLIEIRVSGKNYSIDPHEVVRFVETKNLVVKGDYSIVEGTEAASLHPEHEDDDDFDVEELDLSAIDDDLENAPDDEAESIKKGATCRLIRRFELGDFLFVPGSARKGSGSYYTPEAIVDDIVKHALGPLVEGKSPAQIESLKVCDPATGSGHFLIGAMRFLGQALHKAYVKEHGDSGPPDFKIRAVETGEKWDTDWGSPDSQARASGSIARAWCKRRIAERCLYGVDLNPTAVMLARVALWVESLAGDRPLSYFDHHIRCGNSLIGTWTNRFSDPPIPFKKKALNKKAQLGLYTGVFMDNIQKAAHQRRLIDVRPDNGDFRPETVDEIKYKKHLAEQSRQLVENARLLFDLRCASIFGLEDIWANFEVLASWGIMKQRGDVAPLEDEVRKQPWYMKFKEVQDRERFFHWELEYPEVFLGENSGFDAIIGNPPWDKVKPDKKEFYSIADVLIRNYVGEELNIRIKQLETRYGNLQGEFSIYQATIKQTATYLKKCGVYPHNTWTINGKKTGGDPDLFKFFIELAFNLCSKEGYVGYLVPSATYNNEGCTGIRYLILNSTSIVRFFGFENRLKIFPIHSSYRFVCLVFQKTNTTTGDFIACFMRNEMQDLKMHLNPLPNFMVILNKDEIQHFSPGNYAFLEYKSSKDQRILKDIITARPRLGDTGDNTWNASFYSDYHMTGDKDLWTDPRTGKLFSVKQIIGEIPCDFDETRARMAEKGFWPVYQDAHIHQFVLEYKPLMRWLNLESHQNKYSRLPSMEPKVVFRGPARNTDERTMIASILPECSVFGHSLTGINITNKLKVPLTVYLNSMVFDYQVRLRVCGMQVSNYLIENCALPGISNITSIPDVPILHVEYSKRAIYDFQEYNILMCEMNLKCAGLLGLSHEDMKYIINTFPVFNRKRSFFNQTLNTMLNAWNETGEIFSEVTQQN